MHSLTLPGTHENDVGRRSEGGKAVIIHDRLWRRGTPQFEVPDLGPRLQNCFDTPKKEFFSVTTRVPQGCTVDFFPMALPKRGLADLSIM